MNQENLALVSMFPPTGLHSEESHIRRRFCCVFLSASARGAPTLDRHLSAAGIRVYHASDAREAEMLLAITSARILLIDIDRTFGPWMEILQDLDESQLTDPNLCVRVRPVR